MAKKQQKAQQPRTDAERRVRQCERLSRVLRALQCIMGPGRWDAEALAEELECSTRTVQRILQTLSMAGVPYRYDAELRAYKLPPKFKFPGLDGSGEVSSSSTDLAKMRSAAKRLLQDGEQFLDSLRALCETLDE